MKLKKETIKIQSANYIRYLILNRKVKPGEKIISEQLAKELNVSRATIREALIELENEKLIESVPYKYTKVKVLTKKEIEEICSIRVLLESYAFEIIKDSISSEDINNLENILEKMGKAAKENDAEGIIKADEQFHAYIVKRSNNMVLYETWQFTNSRLLSLFYAIISQVKDFTYDIMVSRHLELVKDLKNGNIEDFNNSLNNHYMKLTNFM
ncbi:MAG: GntR family transcriptional regulator [Tissierellia bacterium]|nr:GntR family transcriptional regulator [Tissierellia bacterium]